jgi:hypothetical protein
MDVWSRGSNTTEKLATILHDGMLTRPWDGAFREMALKPSSSGELARSGSIRECLLEKLLFAEVMSDFHH